MLSAPVLLTNEQIRSEFACGVTTLDDWLKRRAYPNQASRASRTYVVTDGQRVVGYYCLASGVLALSDTPSPLRRNMPDPVAMGILGRLAVDRNFHGKGLALPCFRTLFFERHKPAKLSGFAVYLFTLYRKRTRHFTNITDSSHPQRSR